MADNVIEVKNVSIEFPGVKALDSVSCTFRSGAVTAVIGANGAGKSTLMKVLAGSNPTYTGDITFNGQPVSLRTPNDAKNIGVSIVYQEVDASLAANLSVAENIMIDYLVYQLKGIGIVNWSMMRKQAKAILEELEIDIDPDTIVSNLTLAQKQMVLIGRVIAQKCNFLILDEPTAPLSIKETEQLFKLVRTLQKRGCGIIFISHRLNELFEICGSIYVMRDGHMIGEREVDGKLRIEDIVEMMLGRTAGEKLDTGGRSIGDVVLETKDFGDAKGRVHDISLQAKAGEIIGISGLVGAGKTELCKALFGIYGKTKGECHIKGKAVNCVSSAEAIHEGIALVPEERRKEGIFLNDDVNHNLSVVTLSRYAKALNFIDRSGEKKAAEKKVEQLRIKTAGIGQKAGLLSGGNQQKVIIGKWLDSDADIYIFDEPTKGIDVGAKQEIYKLILSLSRQGKTILYTSSETSEILLLSDRIYVMYDGTIQKELRPGETNEEEILYYSTGGKKRD